MLRDLLFNLLALRYTRMRETASTTSHSTELILVNTFLGYRMDDIYGWQFMSNELRL